MSPLHHPALYQINTRVWLTELSRTLGRSAALARTGFWLGWERAQ